MKRSRMKKLKRHAVDWTQIERFLASAEKKLSAEDSCV